MSQSTWGSATDKQSGGGSDPNILKLGDSTRVRLLDEGPRKWRQHFIESTSDPDQGRSVVCPKGADGRESAPCPLCMKPVDSDGKTRLFPISRRFATNVWDYESGSVKVLLGGPQIFEEFDSVAKVGMDPTATDFVIFKSGKGTNTSYKVIRGDTSPLPQQITPDMLHDLDKYDVPATQEKIFEVLDELGWDYDALEMPSFTLDAAEKMQMPYGRMKGLTIEQVVAQDTDYAKFLHTSKKDQGSYGDPIFVALQTVLEDRGEVPPLEDVPAPPRPASASAPSTPAPTDPGMIDLINPAGETIQVPAAARDAMLAAGFTEPPVPEVQPQASGEQTLVGPDGNEVTVPDVAVAGLLAAGFKQKTEAPAADAEPSDDTIVEVDISGTKAELPYGQAKGLIAAGTATLVKADAEAPEAPPAEPAFQLPGDDEQVNVLIGGNPVPMPFATAKATVASGAATFEDSRITAALDDDGAVKEQIQAAAASDPSPPAGHVDLDPSKAEQGEDGRWRHPALDKDYATKGAVTQALNRMKKDDAPAAAAPAASTPVPASNGAAASGAAASGKEALLEIAKNKMASMPELTKDFKVLLGIFQEVAGKRNITDFDEGELQKLIAKLDEMAATA